MCVRDGAFRIDHGGPEVDGERLEPDQAGHTPLPPVRISRVLGRFLRIPGMLAGGWETRGLRRGKSVLSLSA